MHESALASLVAAELSYLYEQTRSSHMIHHMTTRRRSIIMYVCQLGSVDESSVMRRGIVQADGCSHIHSQRHDGSGRHTAQSIKYKLEAYLVGGVCRVLRAAHSSTLWYYAVA